MTMHRPARLHDSRMCAVVALCVGLLACSAEAQTQPPGRRSGGLLPTRETPTISNGRTRDEMLRKFDLDADGRIDEGEAEAARTKMRRERNQALQNSGIDPITGRPRGSDAADEPPPADDELRFPSADPPEPPSRKPAAAAEKKPAVQQPPTAPSGRPPVITGGVRAGASAVRPGYGSTGPKQELNAGRPREPQVTPGQARIRAGMQPAGRPPAQPGTPRAATPRPSLFPQGSARPTAEDFGR